MIVILGDGLLGSELANQSGFTIISRKKSGFDVSSPLSNFIPKDCTILINCIAHTDTYSKEKEKHWDVNYKFVHKLITFCNNHKIKLVHIGTDYMYANNKLTFSSEDEVPVHAENWYSYTKLLGDGLIQLLSEDYLICRCIHKPYPYSLESAYIDRYANFDYTHNIAKIILELIYKNASGVFNVGPKAKSAYEFVRQTNPHVLRSYTPDGLPKDTSMNVTKLETFLKNE